MSLALPSTGSAPPIASDSLQRPDPGLARGRWEGPAWMFWLLAGAALVGGLAWLAMAFRSRKASRTVSRKALH